jgi:hypothetical protein
VVLIFVVSALAILVSPLFFFSLLMLMALVCLLTVLSNRLGEDAEAASTSTAFPLVLKTANTGSFRTPREEGAGGASPERRQHQREAKRRATRVKPGAPAATAMNPAPAAPIPTQSQTPHE